MRTRGAVVHQGACCASEVAAFVQAGRQFFIAIHFILSEAEETNVPVLLLSDRDLFLLNESVNDLIAGVVINRLMIEEVMKLLIVNLEECALDNYVGLVPPLVDFFKYKLYDSGDDPEFLILDPNCVPAAHSERLSTASLSISEYGRIVALKAAEDEVLNTDIEHVLLASADVEDFVKGEGAVFADDELVILIVTFDADVWRFK